MTIMLVQSTLDLRLVGPAWRNAADGTNQSEEVGDNAICIQHQYAALTVQLNTFLIVYKASDRCNRPCTAAKL